MCATKANRNAIGAKAGALRIEPVDNWHRSWNAVIQLVRRSGNVKRLHIDSDGWLSARQVLLVAFAGDAPAAHVCFSVSPSADGCIEAKLDSYGIDPQFRNRGIESQLHQAAKEKAESLKCEKLRGFKFNSEWC